MRAQLYIALVERVFEQKTKLIATEQQKFMVCAII